MCNNRLVKVKSISLVHSHSGWTPPPWTSWTLCDYAASLGSIRLLKWARENNLDWSVDTCVFAAAYGQLPALQFLHENGCPWDLETCYYAALRKQWDCVQYAVDNKCPWWKEFAEEYAEHLR